MLLAGPKLKPENRFHFTQVELPKLDLQPGEVHGLLGQRALRRPRGAPVQLAGAGTSSAAALAAAARFGPQGEGAIVGKYTDYAVGALGEHDGSRFTRFWHCGE